MQLACVQVLGGHGKAVLAIAGGAQGPGAPVSPFDLERAQAALDACTRNQGAIVSSTQRVLASSPAEVRAKLAEAFNVLTPAEARLGRTKSPAQSLKAIGKALESLPVGVPKKALLAWLENGGAIEPLLRADPDVLKNAMVADAEVFNVVDERLLSLWVRAGHHQVSFPSLNDLEYGFDRRAAILDQLAAAGMNRGAAENMLLGRWSEMVRTWPSTGVAVWEALSTDGHAFCRRVLALEDGDRRLAFALQALLELPDSVLKLGGLDLVRKICADASLVPDTTMERLLRSDKERLSGVARSGKSAHFTKAAAGVIRAVPLIDLR